MVSNIIFDMWRHFRILVKCHHLGPLHPTTRLGDTSELGGHEWSGHDLRPDASWLITQWPDRIHGQLTEYLVAWRLAIGTPGQI